MTFLIKRKYQPVPFFYTVAALRYAIKSLRSLSFFSPAKTILVPYKCNYDKKGAQRMSRNPSSYHRNVTD
jgi:hypothetical protein